MRPAHPCIRADRPFQEHPNGARRGAWACVAQAGDTCDACDGFLQESLSSQYTDEFRISASQPVTCVTPLERWEGQDDDANPFASRRRSVSSWVPAIAFRLRELDVWAQDGQDGRRFVI